MKSLNFLPFLDIMEFTSDRINNYINLLTSLLKDFTMFKLNVGGMKNKKVI